MDEKIILTKELYPQFCEADPDGRVGVRGYINQFQNAVTEYTCSLGLGGDELYQKHGTAWIYTKYKIHIDNKAIYAPMQQEAWIEQKKSFSSLLLNLSITQNGSSCMSGKLEFCLFNQDKNALCRITDIDYPVETQVDKSVEVASFSRIKPGEEKGEYMLSHQVLYSDLDSNVHMNNIRYIDMLLNAYDSEFYKTHFISDFEIHYLKQSYEKEILRVYAKDFDGGKLLTAEKEDGSVAVRCMMKFR